MEIGVLQYGWRINSTIRQAQKQGAISQQDVDYLCAMAEESVPASYTAALINAKGVPDFLYAALYFSTMIWHSGEVAGRDSEARAGLKLANFVLQKEPSEYDPYWAAKLLHDLYDAHEEARRRSIASTAQSSGLAVL
jgi:hypothetical protein